MPPFLSLNTVAYLNGQAEVVKEVLRQRRFVPMDDETLLHRQLKLWVCDEKIHDAVRVRRSSMIGFRSIRDSR